MQMTLGLRFSMSIHWQLNSQCQAYITSGTNVCSIKQTGAEFEGAMNQGRSFFPWRRRSSGVGRSR